MSIHVIGVGRPGSGRTSKDIIAAVLGHRDSYGNAFELINLVSTISRSDNMSTHGYEDTIITARPGSPISIKYRRPGRIRWERSLFGGFPTAKLARTSHNLMKLSHAYYNGNFRINDAHIDKIVKKMADDRLKLRTPEQIKADNEADRLRKINGFGQTMKRFVGVSPQRQSVDAREASIAKREADVARKEAELEAKAGPIKEAEIEAVGYTEESLGKMKYFGLVNTAKKEFGLDVDTNTPKADIIRMIMAKQTSNSVETEDDVETVTG